MEHVLALLQDGAVLVLTLGYTGIFLALLIEGSGIPLPFPGSAFLAFVGYAVWRGRLGFLEASVAAALGSTVGAWLLYRVARDAGPLLMERYGRRLALTSAKVSRAESWFRTHAGRATFFARVTPGVRIYISVAAGLARLNQGVFIIGTLFGAWLWAAVLILAGWMLGESWHTVSQFMSDLQLSVLTVAVVLGVLLLVLRQIGEQRRLG